MKILQINSVYNQGSTGKLTAIIHKSLIANNVDSKVCYSRGAKVNDKSVIKIGNDFACKINHFISNLTGFMYGAAFLSTLKIKHLINKEKPDVVHLQCINSNVVNIYELIKWLNAKKISTVLTLHAEFMYTANCSHSFECNQWMTGCTNCKNFKEVTGSYYFNNTKKSFDKMKIAFNGFDNLIVVSVSEWLRDRAEKSLILKDKTHKVIYNCIDTDIFKISFDNVLYNQYIKYNKVIFHVTPYFNDDINHIKGGYYVIKLAEKLLASNVHFIVAGNYDSKIKVPSNITFIGNISDQSLLTKYYNIADYTLLTSKRETFSMVTAESLCCGTPVIGFKAGAPEQIAIPSYSNFVEYADIDSLVKIIESSYNYDRVIISNDSHNVYSTETMTNKYIKIYQEIIDAKTK